MILRNDEVAVPHRVLPCDERHAWNGTARFSRDGVYRYELSRVWNAGAEAINFLMLNPSTADETCNDPTVHRCVERGWRLGFSQVVVTNLFALRSTDPQALYSAPDPVGPRNDAAILRAARAARVVVVAWGEHGAWNGRSRRVTALLARHKISLFCLGTNRSGEPRPPLYLPYGAALTPFQPPGG